MQTILGKYEVRATIATGPMSTVYEGWDTAIARRVAIKAVPLAQTGQSEGWQHLTRFRREAQAAGRLQHPTVVGIFDYGENAEFAFIVMEFVDGGTLKSVLEDGKRFSIAAVNLVMQDILAGLQYSHGQGVIHRDIKPANIMLTREGRAKIADFGIARIENSDITQVGMIMGTPAYMSPEQFRGEATSASTDIYSAGVILYQLLTGERPFDGGLATIMHKALGTDPPKPSEISGAVPHSADAVVARAMAKRPDQRFRDAQEFAQALQGALAARPGEPARQRAGMADWRSLPGRATAPGRMGSLSSNYRKYLMSAAVLVALAMAAGTVAYRMSTSKSALPPEARRQEAAPPSMQASQTGAATAPAASPAKSEPAPQATPVDLPSALSAVPYQAPPMQPLAIPIPPTPVPPDLPARVLAPALLTPAIPQYSLSLGVPNPPTNPQKPPQAARKEARSAPRSVVKQPAEPGTETPGSVPAATPAQPNGSQAERRAKDAAPPQEAARSIGRETSVASPSPASPDDGATVRTFGTYGVVNGRRVFVPASSPDR